MAGEKVQVQHWDGAAGKWTDVPVGINYDTAKQVAVNATALGDTTVVAAVAGKKIRVFAGLIMASINVDVAWADDTPNTMINAMWPTLVEVSRSTPFLDMPFRQLPVRLFSSTSAQTPT